MKSILAEDVRRELTSQLTAMKTGDLSPIFRSIGQDVRLAFANTFAIAASFTEGKWKKRKHVGDGHPLLIDTGRLFRGATTGGAEGHIADYGKRVMKEGIDSSVIVYAAAQNFGYPERNLPARRYIDLTTKDVDKFAVMISDFTLELMGA